MLMVDFVFEICWLYAMVVHVSVGASVCMFLS